MAVLGVSAAFAADLSWTSDTNVTINGDTYVISSPSEATSAEIAATTLTVTVPSGSTFTLISNDRYLLTNDQSILQNCSGGQNSITIAGAQTVVITPNNGSTCTTTGTGSGGGGGGGSSTPAPADTTAPISTSISINAGAAKTTTASVTLTLGAADSSGVSSMMIANDSAFTGAVFETYATSKSWTLTSGNGVKTVYAKFKDAAGNVSAAVSDTITLDTAATTADTTPPPASTTTLTAAQIQAQIDALNQQISSTTAGQSGQVPKGILTKALNIGSKGNEVTVLQNFLKAQGSDIYPEGLVTGYYGPATTKAIQRFQLKYGIVSAPGEVGYGNLGPKTRAKVNELLGGTTSSVPTSAPSTTSGLQRALTVGSTGSDVTTLQNFLKAQGSDIYPEGLVTGYYGPATTKAIQRFQLNYGIVSAPGEVGYGNLGPKTRAKVNELLGN